MKTVFWVLACCPKGVHKRVHIAHNFAHYFNELFLTDGTIPFLKLLVSVRLHGLVFIFVNYYIIDLMAHTRFSLSDYTSIPISEKPFRYQLSGCEIIFMGMYHAEVQLIFTTVQQKFSTADLQGLVSI